MPKYIELLYSGHSSSAENDGYEIPRTNVQKHENVVNSDMPASALNELNDSSRKGSEKANEFVNKGLPEKSYKIKTTTNTNSINVLDC